MRKSILFLLMASFVLSCSIAYSYDDPTYSANKINNTQDRQKEEYREIKLVRYGVNTDNSSASLVSGDAVVYSVVSADGVTVRKSTQSSDGSFAGIVCTTIQTGNSSATSFSDDAGRRNWGYIVVYGPADAGVTAGGTNGNVWGEGFLISTDSGKITSNPTKGATALAVKSDVWGNGGFFMQSADSTSTSVKVFVKAT